MFCLIFGRNQPVAGFGPSFIGVVSVNNQLLQLCIHTARVQQQSLDPFQFLLASDVLPHSPSYYSYRKKLLVALLLPVQFLLDIRMDVTGDRLWKKKMNILSTKQLTILASSFCRSREKNIVERSKHTQKSQSFQLLIIVIKNILSNVRA